MNTTSLQKSLIISSILFCMMVSTTFVFAETKVIQKTETSSSEKVIVDATQKKDEGVQNESTEASIKNWFNAIYQKVDAWRIHQSEIWTGIKNEKEAQIAAQTQEVDTNRDNRVNRILNEEQTTLFNGAGTDLKGDGNIFLLRLYSFALFLFVIVFTTPIIFYGIIILVTLAIVSKIIQKIRNPQQ